MIISINQKKKMGISELEPSTYGHTPTRKCRDWAPMLLLGEADTGADGSPGSLRAANGRYSALLCSYHWKKHDSGRMHAQSSGSSSENIEWPIIHILF
jgi:hypothetical protein